MIKLQLFAEDCKTVSIDWALAGQAVHVRLFVSRPTTNLVCWSDDGLRSESKRKMGQREYYDKQT